MENNSPQLHAIDPVGDIEDLVDILLDDDDAAFYLFLYIRDGLHQTP